LVIGELQRNFKQEGRKGGSGEEQAIRAVGGGLVKVGGGKKTLVKSNGKRVQEGEKATRGAAALTVVRAKGRIG